MTAGKNFKRLVRDRARRTGQAYSSARRQLLRQTSEDHMNDSLGDPADQLVPVWPGNVRTSKPDDTPFLVLEEVDGDRMLPIAIGAVEATAIAFAMQHVTVKRPMTHDALKQAIDALGGTVDCIVVGFQPDANTFTADVVVDMPDGSDRHLDWRVSDAVAVAVRCARLPRSSSLNRC